MRDKNWRLVLGQGQTPFAALTKRRMLENTNAIRRITLNGQNFLHDRGKMMPRLMNIDEWTCTNLVEARQSKLSEAVTELLIRVSPPSVFPLDSLRRPKHADPLHPATASSQTKNSVCWRHRGNAWDFLRHTATFISMVPNIKSMTWYKSACDGLKTLSFSTAFSFVKNY